MEEPIRVLQIVTQMNRGGMESRLMDIYRNIDHSRIQFDFFTCRMDKGQFDDEIEALGGKVFYSQPLSIKNMLSIPKLVKGFLIKHPEYKIVHAHVNQWCGLILKGAQKVRVPVRIAHSRTSLEVHSAKNFVKNIIKISTNKYAIYRFAVSEKAGKWLFGPNTNFEVWPNAIQCEKFTFESSMRYAVREELGLKDEFTVIHVGNLKPEKNHSFLLEVFAELLKIHECSRLVLVGKDGVDGAFARKAKELCISEKVSFLGSRNDVNRLLQGGDVFVFPSLYEGFPGAVLEAQASGLPCIISDTITSEVCITQLVTQLPLSIGAKKWVESIIQKKGYPRNDTQSYFKQTGYDINSLVVKLMAFYEDVMV
jgi:glycosyltransferase involved in cell wall biosynthesis